MKLVSHIKEGHEQLAILVNDRLYDADEVHPELPSTMGMLLNYWEEYTSLSRAIHKAITDGKIPPDKGKPLDEVILLSPVTQPSSLRIAVSSSDGADFFFGNHHSIQGPGEVRCMPKHFEKLDFEPGLAIVICKPGRNIQAAAAQDYIGGYMILNSFTARSLETSLAKGGNIASVLGPWLVTADELEEYKEGTSEGSVDSFGFPVSCQVNGEQLDAGSTGAIRPDFAKIIERCSYGADLYPGDIICTTVQINKTNAGSLLKAGDEVEVGIGGLGSLISFVVAEEDE